MVVKLYVEGGGDSRRLKTKCRRGFRKFLDSAGICENKPRIIACGSRKTAYDDFRTAMKNVKPDDFPILLVDSEDPVKNFGKVWEHLRNRPDDKWEKPDGATDEHAHLMVQLMESWFLADKQCLRKFYGHTLNEGALRPNPKIEEIPKDDVMDSLENATRHTETKGEYSKGSHSFEILENLDPEKVFKASPHAKRFVDTLKEKTG